MHFMRTSGLEEEIEEARGREAVDWKCSDCVRVSVGFLFCKCWKTANRKAENDNEIKTGSDKWKNDFHTSNALFRFSSPLSRPFWKKNNSVLFQLYT